ncbi:MAG TPA: thioredoxin family protein [Candidatus Baltobacteraceae bacterium]|jgi:hypothetical protein|nr:thioredoxin family protein [Candidatus Baltobacteraceae bacterium]
MRILLAILVNLLAVVWPAFGDDRLPTLRVGDTTFSNVLVLRVTATDLYFTSDNGIGNAKLTDLDPALRAQFAPDAAKAGEAEKIQADANALYLRATGQQTSFPPLDDQAAIPTAGADSASTNKVLAKSFLGQRAPDLPVLQWISASPDTREKLVLIDFWATTNEASVNFIGKLNDFLKQYGDRLAIIGISNESEEAVRKVVDPNIEYASALDTQNQLESAMELTAIPYAIVLDTNWIVRWEGNPVDKTNALTGSIISGLIDKYCTPPISAAAADGSNLQ